MSNFDDNFEQADVDPAAEFLAREQDELAGLEDEVKPAAVSVPQVNGGNNLFFSYSGGVCNDRSFDLKTMFLACLGCEA